MDLGTVAIVALVAGLAGGAVGAALVGTVEAIFRRHIEKSTPSRTWTTRHSYTRTQEPER